MKSVLPVRSESIAYPNTSASHMMSRLQYLCRQNGQKIMATLAFFLFVVFMSSDYAYDASSNAVMGRYVRSRGTQYFGGAYNPGYFKVEDALIGSDTFKFAAVTDLDQLSRIKTEEEPTFVSHMLLGEITFDSGTNTYSLTMEDEMRQLITEHNEAGRGAEFSELTLYNNHLLTFDDRTGDVFEIRNKPDGKESFVVPRVVITEGEGETGKGMKWEWATVKDGLLYLGSMGKEYTRKDGTIKNRNNLWIVVMDGLGTVTRVDWRKQYDVVRGALGASSPGYVIHEAVNWSSHLKRWVFLPRRISTEAYDDSADERKGSNKLVLVDAAFRKPEVVNIRMKTIDPLHGFSSFAFIPNSHDRHALALRSVEEDCVGGKDDICKQRSYLMVFDVLTGDVLLDEVKIPANMKFEGVEFVNMQQLPPS